MSFLYRACFYLLLAGLIPTVALASKPLPVKRVPSKPSKKTIAKKSVTISKKNSKQSKAISLKSSNRQMKAGNKPKTQMIRENVLLPSENRPAATPALFVSAQEVENESKLNTKLGSPQESLSAKKTIQKEEQELTLKSDGLHNRLNDVWSVRLSTTPAHEPQYTRENKGIDLDSIGPMLYFERKF